MGGALPVAIKQMRVARRDRRRVRLRHHAVEWENMPLLTQRRDGPSNIVDDELAIQLLSRQDSAIKRKTRRSTPFGAATNRRGRG